MNNAIVYDKLEPKWFNEKDQLIASTVNELKEETLKSVSSFYFINQMPANEKEAKQELLSI